jgi:hypothetical protein
VPPPSPSLSSAVTVFSHTRTPFAAGLSSSEQALVSQAAQLFTAIKTTVVSTDALSDPRQVQRLVFPSLNPAPSERFAIKEDGTFAFMGRSHFSTLSKNVHELHPRGFGGKAPKMLFYGTIGFGKSHSLAALALVLMQEDKRVVFLPTHKDLLDDRVKYFRKALLLAFGDSPELMQELMDAITQQELVRFCDQQAELYFVVDQWNALDANKQEDDARLALRKGDCKEMIDNAAFGFRIVRGASANNESAKVVGQHQDNVFKMCQFGGFDKVRSWLSRSSCVGCWLRVMGVLCCAVRSVYAAPCSLRTSAMRGGTNTPPSCPAR